MDKIRVQANTVSQLVFSSETATTYKKALTLTWDIVRETAILIWLVVCLVFVGADWFYRISIQLGSRTRDWYETLGQKGDGGSKDAPSMNTTGKALLHAGQSGVTFLLTQARDQLGMKAPEASSTSQPAPEPPKSKAASKASSSATSSTTASEGEDVDSKA